MCLIIDFFDREIIGYVASKHNIVVVVIKILSKNK